MHRVRESEFLVCWKFVRAKGVMPGAFSKEIDVHERSSRNVSSIRKELRMKLITQRTMMAAAALSLSALIAGCGARSTNPSTEKFTVYQDAPKMSLLDLGAPGNSLGDVYHFSAPLHSERGGPVTGEIIGSKTLMKMPSDANPNLERRATLMFFTFADGNDQIIALALLITRRQLLNLVPASWWSVQY